MNKNIILLAAGAVMLSVASCSVEESKLTPVASDPRVPMEFTTLSTKTALVPSDDNAVVWSADDAVAIFDGTYANKFTISSEPGTSSATFAGEAVPDADYYAIYPFSNDAELNGTVISSVLPAEQHYVAGTFDTMLNPSVAKALGGATELSFSNVASILQVNVENLGDKVVKEVAVKATEKLAGDYTVEMSGDEYIAKAAENAVAEVKVVADEAVAADKFYAVLLPGTYTGLTVTVTYSDGTYSEKAVSSSVEMPVSGGRIVSVDGSAVETPASESLYDKFMAGEDIIIAGKTYNRSQYPNNDDIQLMEDTKSAIYNTSDTYGDGKIIFIDIPDQDKPVSIGNAGDIVVIGNNPDKKPTVIRSASNLNDAGNKRLVLANLTIDMPNSVTNKGEAVKNGFVANSAFSELTLDNCDILMNETTPLILVTAAGRAISNINIENCKINIPAGNSNRYIVTTGGIETTIDMLNFRNNIVYCDNGMATTFRLVNSQNANTKTTIKDIVIENNTLSNICYNNSAMVIALNIDQATVTKNLVYFNTSSWSGVTQQYHCILRAYGSYPATANCTDNIAYYDQSVTTGVTGENAGGRYYFRIFQSPSFEPTTGSAEEFNLIEVDPFASGDFATFTPATEYAEYGAQR